MIRPHTAEGAVATQLRSVGREPRQVAESPGNLTQPGIVFPLCSEHELSEAGGQRTLELGQHTERTQWLSGRTEKLFTSGKETLKE